jgi:hypothetical protein
MNGGQGAVDLKLNATGSKATDQSWTSQRHGDPISAFISSRDRRELG